MIVIRYFLIVNLYKINPIKYYKMKFELYEQLGLNRNDNPSINDIKKAYKINAMKYHPDKNKGDATAEKKFKEISHAYDILSDENKKRMYDQRGDEHFNNNQGDHPGHGSDIFEHFFRGRRGFDGHPFGFHEDMQQNEGVKCKDINKQFNISLDDAFNGVNKSLNITITKHCHDCLKTCTNCNGTGTIKHVKSLGVFTQIFQASCDHCSNGFVSSPKSSCETCQGKAKFNKDMNAKLSLPKGVKSGFKTVFKEMGEQPKNHKDKPGNLVFNVVVQEHPVFKRKDNDLYYKIDLSFVESIVGKDIEIPFFNNEKININTNIFGVVYPGKQYMIQNKGMPIINSNTFGNMFIEFNIKYPKIKNTNRVKELEELLKEVF